MIDFSPCRAGQPERAGEKENLPHHHQGLPTILCCGVANQTGDQSDGAGGRDFVQPERPIGPGFLPWGGVNQEDQSWTAGEPAVVFVYPSQNQQTQTRRCLWSFRPSRFLTTPSRKSSATERPSAPSLPWSPEEGSFTSPSPWRSRSRLSQGRGLATATRETVLPVCASSAASQVCAETKCVRRLTNTESFQWELRLFLRKDKLFQD